MKHLILATIVAVMLAAAPDDTSLHQRFAATQARHHAAQIEAAAAEVAELQAKAIVVKKAPVKMREKNPGVFTRARDGSWEITFQAGHEKYKAIKAVNEALDAAEARLAGMKRSVPTNTAPRLFNGVPDPVGAVGILTAPNSLHTYSVAQVIDGSSLLVRQHWFEPYVIRGGRGVVGSRPTSGQEFWIEGVDTTNLLPDEVIGIQLLVEYVDNKTYPTVVGGSNTVPRYRVLDVKALPEQARAAVAADIKTQDAKTRMLRPN